MPAWSFHIKLASEVSAVLNLDEQEKNLFILSNLIPDIKSGFLIPMDKPVWSKYSHYYIYKDELSLPDLEKYKNTFFQYRISLYAQFTKNSFYNHLLLLQYKQKAHVQLVSFHKNYILMYIKQFHFPHISLRNPTIYDHKSPSRSS